jgi:hypothetical protein
VEAAYPLLTPRPDTISRNLLKSKHFHLDSSWQAACCYPGIVGCDGTRFFGS